MGNESGKAVVLVGQVAVNRWLPGDVALFTPEFFQHPPDLPPGDVAQVSEAVVLPAELPAGQYVLSLAVVDEAQQPVLQLAIKGRAGDGWYPLSSIRVTR